MNPVQANWLFIVISVFEFIGSRHQELQLYIVTQLNRALRAIVNSVANRLLFSLHFLRNLYVIDLISLREIALLAALSLLSELNPPILLSCFSLVNILLCFLRIMSQILGFNQP